MQCLYNKKMKILVTGGLGFIGSHTVVELQNEGFEVIALPMHTELDDEQIKFITDSVLEYV